VSAVWHGATDPRAVASGVVIASSSDEVLRRPIESTQYASTAYQRLLQEAGFTPSMSRPGDCWDNAVVESFFATLTKELLVDGVFATHAEASRALFEFIEIWYNRQRRHSALGYRSPVQFEDELLQAS
jgi:transposase InsO family protein